MQEKDIRPGEIHDEYLRLSAQDIKEYFKPSEWTALDCPACDGSSGTHSFTKHGFEYRTCDQCHSLFQSPRASVECFNAFYSQSKSSHYWATTFFPSVVEARREMIFKPRVRQISELCRQREFFPETIIDVGAGYGVFLEEWKYLVGRGSLWAVEPHAELAERCRKNGMTVLQTTSEKAQEWANKGDLVTCFEVIEHAHSPHRFVQSIFELVRPGGYAVISGLGADGFDIQVLWEKSKAVSPPHHLNFLSVQGFESLFKKIGFTSVEVLTPGQLDVDIVNNFISQYGSREIPRFVVNLLSRGPAMRAALQTFLRENKLSSHTWILAQKPMSGAKT